MLRSATAARRRIYAEVGVVEAVADWCLANSALRLVEHQPTGGPQYSLKSAARQHRRLIALYIKGCRASELLFAFWSDPQRAKGPQSAL